MIKLNILISLQTTIFGRIKFKTKYITRIKMGLTKNIILVMWIIPIVTNHTSTLR